jgi:hypothetical protein
LAAAFIIVCIVALARQVLPTDSGLEDAGQGAIAKGFSPPVPSRSPVLAPVPTGDLLGTLSPDRRNAQSADALAHLVATEKRDPDWAGGSEAAIQERMGSLAYIGGHRPLRVYCAATVCEVSGLAEPDGETGSMDTIWEALEHETAGDELGYYGLERIATRFGTSSAPGAFTLYYRRLGSTRRP